MAGNDEDRFRIKPAAPKSRGGSRSQRFVSQVLKQASKAGAKPSGKSLGRPANTFGRGRVAASMAGQRLGPNARRMVIKSRFVVLQRASPNSVAVHLRYIERDGVTRDGLKGQAYAADNDAADLKAFQERGQNNRHQFRFIVSAEDGLELEDLKGFTRQLMRRMEIDLETRLDWVAVDHWDTGHPHTHIVLNGHTDGPASGRENLVIAPDYMAHGMRLRASEIATDWLGPRTALEIRQGLLSEVEAERFTSLDRTLLQQEVAGVVDLTDTAGETIAGRQQKITMRSRLRRLEDLELAEKVDANRWRLSPTIQSTLTALGARGDIVRTIQKAMKGEQRMLVIDAEPAAPVVGCIVAKGLADELRDIGYLVVDGLDGRAHYVRLPTGADLSALPVGGIVEVMPPASMRADDSNVLAVAKEGIQKAADHLNSTGQAPNQERQASVAAHMRRQDALRAAGIEEPAAAGVWKPPQESAQRPLDRDARKSAGLTIKLRSHLPISQQARAMGATWLDKQLVKGNPGVCAQGYGAQVLDATRRRVQFLIEQGLAQQRGQRFVLARDLLATLRNRDLANAGMDLQQQTGRNYRPTGEGHREKGLYARSVQLVSGRFAMLDDGISFSLVPWRPVLEQKIGQHVSAVVRGSSVSFQFGRTASIGL